MGERAVSTVVSYVLVLGIVAILVTTLLGNFAPFVTDQQQRTAGSTMSVLGNDLAGDLAAADRLATRAGTDGAVELRTSLPERVGGSRYEIEVRETGGDGHCGSDSYEIALRTFDFDATALVCVRTQIEIADRTLDDPLDGGPLEIVYEVEDGTPRLVIRDV